MKKSMIALTALLISAVILCFSQAGATGSADETTVLTAVPSVEATEENTAAEASTKNPAAESSESSYAGAVQAQTTAEASSLTANGATASSTISTARTTTTKPAVNIAPAVQSPATAARTTTTTRYVPPQTASIATTSTRYVLPATSATTTTRSTTTSNRPTTTTTRVTTTTRATTTTTRAATTTTTQAKTDYEAMGQAKYQEEAIKALNALRAERGQPAMTINTTLMTNSLTHAQAMAAAGKEFHSTTNLPGCESVCRVPINFPAVLLGETLGKHTPQFLESNRYTVGIAVVRHGNYLYAVMQGN